MDFRWLIAAGLIAGVSACAQASTPPPAQPTAPTSPAVNTSTSTGTSTLPAPTDTGTPTLPADTETPTPTATLMPGAIEIAYGQKLTNSHRGRPVFTYAFRGQEDEVITIVLQIFNLHPNWVYCRGQPPAADLDLDIGFMKIKGASSGVSQSAIKDYRLTTSGAFYITAVCRGASCSRDCFQQTISLAKQ